MPFIIAIDGPAGAGKSTVARKIAQKLEYTYLDTGAMYRSVAWNANRVGADMSSSDQLVRIATEMEIRFSPLSPELSQSVIVNGTDISDEIRTSEISNLTSRVATFEAVRRCVVEQQRRIASAAVRGVVLEGRDIGSVVFPDAQMKLFLTASPVERANRRVEQLRSLGLPVDPDRTLEEIIERDRRDSERKASPLIKAEGAIELNTDNLSIDEVTAQIYAIWQERQP